MYAVLATCSYAAYLSLWNSGEGEPLEQLNEGNLSLQQSKPYSDADARAKAEWHVAKLRPLGLFLWCKPVVILLWDCVRPTISYLPQDCCL